MKEMLALSEQGFRLKVRASVLLVLAVLISVLVGYLVFNKQFSAFRNDLVNQQNLILSRASSMVSASLGDAGVVVSILYNSASVQSSLKDGRAVDRVTLANGFRGIASALDLLCQVRWLNAEGMEVVRIDRHDGQIVEAAPGQLQDKSDRYYFQDAIRLSGTVRYFSPIDLNVENGEIVIPYQPTIRVGLRTGDGDGLQPGLILINYELGRLLERLRLLSQSQVQLLLADQRGKWLLHEKPEREWGADTGRSGVNAAEEMPLLWHEVKQGDQFLGKTLAEGIYSHESLTLPGAPVLHLLAVTDDVVVKEVINSALIVAVTSAVLLFLLLAFLVHMDWRAGYAQLQLSMQLKQDKTDLKSGNDKLEKALSELSMLQEEVIETRKLSSLGMMVAGVAHELNTPVGGALMMASEIKSALETLQQSLINGLTRKDFDDYLERTARSVELLNLNLNRAKATVLGFKRLASDRVNEEIDDFDLNVLVDDLVTSFSPVLRQNRITVINDVPAGLVVYGYAGFMSQILQNLMLNALQHAFSAVTNPVIRIGAEVAGDSIDISVSDNGSGVAADIADKIFDPFVTTRRGEGSTGLGLYLVHRWVTHLMHGTISTARAEEGGLLVRLKVPVVMQARSQSDPAHLH